MGKFFNRNYLHIYDHTITYITNNARIPRKSCALLQDAKKNKFQLIHVNKIRRLRRNAIKVVSLSDLQERYLSRRRPGIGFSLSRCNTR
jgi:hypothetical protein